MVQLAPKHQLAFVQRPPHSGVLRSLSGKHERHGPLFILRRASKNARTIRFRQCCHRVSQVVTDDNPAMLELLPAGAQRKCDVREIELRMTLKMSREISAR